MYKWEFLIVYCGFDTVNSSIMTLNKINILAKHKVAPTVFRTVNEYVIQLWCWMYYVHKQQKQLGITQCCSPQVNSSNKFLNCIDSLNK